MLKTGFARTDITPPRGLSLMGYPHYDRFNTGAHDPLYAACMYLDNGENAVAMVTLDLLYFSKPYVMKVRKLAEEKCGINGENIMITCTHTHSGPRAYKMVADDDPATADPKRDAYVEDIIVKIADLVAEAKNTAFDGEFAYNVALCGAEQGVGGNRRVPGGPHDPLVSVMAVKDMKGDLRGVLVNYSLHPTFIHEWVNECTADYPAYVKMQVEETYPTALSGFGQGASGNQSSRYYRKGESFDEAERVGRAIGKAACEAIAKMKWLSDIEIKTVSTTMEMELRDFGPIEELEKQVEHDTAVYKELYAKYGKSEKREEYLLWQNANLKCLGSENKLAYALKIKNGEKLDRLQDESPVELQAFNLGGLCVIGVPGEMFVEYALYVKAMAGFGMVIFNETTNGCLPGYVHTPEALTFGGYETDTSVIGEKFGQHIVKKILDTVEKIK